MRFAQHLFSQLLGVVQNAQTESSKIALNHWCSIGEMHLIMGTYKYFRWFHIE